jgi:hypothetical protein
LLRGVLVRVALIVGAVLVILVVGGFMITPSLGIGALVGAILASVILVIAMRSEGSPKDGDYED